jgi:signal transduction histidine kinase
MTETLEFKISSGLKNIIGKELIVNDLIAIFELVKNSYDAYAKSVKIVFINIKEENRDKGSKILIIDDGQGMSKEDIKNKWLFVGYSEKKELENFNNKRKDYRDKIQEKRIFAGAKGIGRFSCDRLGRELTVYTKKERENNIHRLDLNWNKFEEDQEREFQTIDVNYSNVDTVPIEYFPVGDFTNGTIIEMSSLNDVWDKKKLLQLKKYLQRLINPSNTGKVPEIEVSLIAPEFEKEDKESTKGDFDIVNGIVRNIVFEKLGIQTTEIECSIDAKSEKIITSLNDKGTYIFRLEEKNEFPLLSNIGIKLFYLNPDAKRTFTKLMGIQPVRYGSIFLYKNRFRIHPYGDEGDDWLELEKRKTQGYARFLSNRELMGRIEIIGIQPDFKEVSSRDGGVIKNQNFSQLTDFFMKKALRRLEKYVVEALEWDAKPKDPDEIKRDSLNLINEIVGQVKDPDKKIDYNPELLQIFQKKQIEKIPQLIENIAATSSYIANPEAKQNATRQIKSLKTAFEKYELVQREKERELEVTQKKSLFLEKAVSTDKEILINLNHSIKITTFVIEKLIKELNEQIKNKKDINEIVSLIDEINLENQKIRILSSYVSFANFDTKVESITKDIVLYIRDYIEKIAARGKDIQIEVINSNLEFVKKFKPLELSIILDNLFDNSRKAGATRIKVLFKKDNEKLHVYISDNGNGMEETAKKFIFKRGFTLTDGSGIGLYHVRKLLESIHGQIRFVDNSVEGLENGACFEMIFE